MLSYSPVVWAAAMAALCSGSPMPLDVPVAHSQNELVVREAMEAAIHTPHLEKRLSADFSMEKTWSNEVLFAGYVAGSVFCRLGRRALTTDNSCSI